MRTCGASVSVAPGSGLRHVASPVAVTSIRGRLAAAEAEFREFFLVVCENQVDYMGGLLTVDGLVHRIRGYCRAREAGAAIVPEGVGNAGKFTPGMSRLVVALAYRG